MPLRTMQGLTLLELAVVLLILVALSTLLMPAIHNTSRVAQCVATDASLAAIREAIMGGGGQAGYLSDVGAYPKHPVSALPTSPYALHYLFEDWNGNYDLSPNTCVSIGPNDPACIHLTSFNPVTQRGWRGPYLQTSGMRCSVLERALIENTLGPADRKAAQDFLTKDQPLKEKLIESGQLETYNRRSPLNTLCNLDLLGQHGTSFHPWSELRVALDSFNVKGLGRALSVRSPILLLADTQHKHYLLSAGGDGVTALTDAHAWNANGEVDPTDGMRRDDRVLYLEGNDRWSNQPCSEY